jgi:hypothetical protein
MPEKPVKIAVAMDKLGVLREIPESECLVFFEKGSHDWEETGCLDFSFEGVAGLCGMRKRLSEYIELLGKDVKAILAAGFPGVSRDVLSRNGYDLYETEIFELGVLEGILEHQEKGDPEEESVPTAPYEKEEGSGVYFLDLRLALNANPDLTTKKILRPFFEKVKFAELEFIYDHFPPWLPLELKTLGYKYKSFDHKGYVMVQVFGGSGTCT